MDLVLGNRLKQTKQIHPYTKLVLTQITVYSNSKSTDSKEDPTKLEIFVSASSRLIYH